MNTIIEKIRNNVVDYKKLLNSCLIVRNHHHSSTCDVLVIIGVRGRKEFTTHVIPSFFKAKSNFDIKIIVVEHASFPSCADTVSQYHVDYVWLPCKDCDQYSRSLAFNVGFLLGGKTRWVLTHDVDCLVQTSFFDNLFQNIDNKQALAIQPFYNNRVVYCNEFLTSDIMNHNYPIDSLRDGTVGTFTSPGKALGGSMMVTSDLFSKVGMYDAELFEGYAPEDQMFWHKLSAFTKVHSCDDPVNEIFHLHHTPTMTTNPYLREMININNSFLSLSHESKMEVIEYKNSIYGTNGLL